MVGGGQKSWNPPAHQANWQGDCSSPMQGVPLGQNLIPDSAYYGKGSLWEQKSLSALLQSAADPFYMRHDGQEDEAVERDVQKLRQNVEAGYMMSYKAENGMPSAGSGNCSLVLKQPHLSGIQAEESLKKVDSFSRWMAKELGEVEELPLQSTNGYSWSVIQTEDVVGDSCTPTQLQLDADTLNFSLSQDQLFSITDFSPNWAYSRLETKVYLKGLYRSNTIPKKKKPVIAVKMVFDLKTTRPIVLMFCSRWESCSYFCIELDYSLLWMGNH
nr:calmodulin-binding transcription activator 2-like isoform X1 [Coffea arabica]XP_027068800.1 calmodulin-binding transcription activator 2-like isoform X1 [Coffea arabica]XP_027116905.1 calmodulin-binding transcription activator 2-like isoform X1 [Coffea arabica]XP_027116906.1 calmodulin-binding transcription activator 2-like isoform X1 [Coffea arabica]